MLSKPSWLKDSNSQLSNRSKRNLMSFRIIFDDLKFVEWVSILVMFLMCSSKRYCCSLQPP